jgi:nicotinamidase-related amidase
MKLLLILLSSLLSLTHATTNLTFNLPTTAFLNLDLLTILVDTFALPNATGQAFIASERKWINALHALDPQPLIIFTRLYFNNPTNPELGPLTPFGAIIGPLLPLQESTPATQIYSGFDVHANDTVLVKTRYYAGTGNALEEILKAKGIDTVVLAGLRTSGVIIDTAFRLFDADFNVTVIRDCTLETPVGAASDAIQEAILGEGGVVVKMGGTVVTLEEALGALGGS